MGLYRKENGVPVIKAGNVDYTELASLKNDISDLWVSGRTYQPGAYVIYNNQVWKCLVANNVAPSEGANWTRVQLTTELGGLRFGFDADGNYGYYKVGADTLTPFKSGAEYEVLQQYVGQSDTMLTWNFQTDNPELLLMFRCDATTGKPTTVSMISMNYTTGTRTVQNFNWAFGNFNKGNTDSTATTYNDILSKKAYSYFAGKTYKQTGYFILVVFKEFPSYKL